MLKDVKEIKEIAEATLRIRRAMGADRIHSLNDEDPPRYKEYLEKYIGRYSETVAKHNNVYSTASRALKTLRLLKDQALIVNSIIENFGNYKPSLKDLPQDKTPSYLSKMGKLMLELFDYDIPSLDDKKYKEYMEKFSNLYGIYSTLLKELEKQQEYSNIRTHMTFFEIAPAEATPADDQKSTAPRPGCAIM